jgi:membrane protein required for colicin V production
MNSFDAVVALVMLLAAALGFRAGLLRSVATMIGYLAAAPLAIAVTPRVTAFTVGPSMLAPNKLGFMLCMIFVALGLGIGALLRVAIHEFAGPDVGALDRVAGATLGAARMAIVAALIVVVWDRLLPGELQPHYLVGSQLRPYLSEFGHRSLQTLWPDIDGYIDQFRREHPVPSRTYS